MAMTPDGDFLPCQNRSCKSYGTSHPNCRCYAHRADVTMAEGGQVPNFCDSDQEHDEGCEHYKAGGRVHNPHVRKHAHSYMKAKGHPISESHHHPVDKARGKAIAHEFEKMEHRPNDPVVKAAYNALIGETLDQFQYMKKAGIKISKIKPDQKNPYAGGSKDVFKDVKENNHLWYYPTEQGFGTQTEIKDHPLLQLTGEMDEHGQPMPANDVFRVVHDYFGHAKEGNGFGPRGEENAWLEHSKMYSPLARKALTTETRGQNSWVNFGPHGEHNRKSPEKTVYADQKAGLLPEWVSEPPQELLHFSQQPEELTSIDPQFMGTGKAGAESGRPDRIQRAYYYEPGQQPEDLVMQSAKRAYKVSRPHNILDLNSEEGTAISATDPDTMESLIHGAGYAGYKNSASQLPGAVALFEAQEPLSSEEVGPEHFRKKYASGGEVEAEPHHQIGARVLSEALQGGMLAGHHDLSDSIMGHQDPQTAIAAVTAYGGAPSLLKLTPKSVFAHQPASKHRQTAERMERLLAGMGLASQAHKPEHQGAIEQGIEHPWFRKGADLHAALPEMTANPKEVALSPLMEKLAGRDVHSSARPFMVPLTMHMLANGATPDELEHGTVYAEHVGQGMKKIDKAVKSIFDDEKIELPNEQDVKARDKLHEYVAEGRLQEEIAAETGAEHPEGESPASEGSDPLAKHFPDQNMMLQAAKARVVGLLNAQRPQPQQTLPFDQPFVPKMQKRRYETALDLAVDPLGILNRVKTGMITPSEIQVFQAMYPELHSVLAQKLTEQIAQGQVDKTQVPMNVRRSLSMFLGTALSATMTPQSIQTIQNIYAKKRAPPPQPAAAPKKTSASLTKAAQGSQTNAQALAARQQRPR